MHGLIVGAPFGNWFNIDHTTSTLGTFTAKRRGGSLYRLWRIVRTLRPRPGLKGWTNKLGLPNPGIDAFLLDVYNKKINVSNKIISVAGHNMDEWINVLSGAASVRPEAIEMNVSCPNCPGADKSDYSQVLKRAADVVNCNSPSIKLIVKLPPINYLPLVRPALDAGIRSFHCCNTLPTPAGGLSGKTLQLFSLQAVCDVTNLCYAKGYVLDLLIGGGGVSSWADVTAFLAAGATNVSVASALFLPWNWRKMARIGRILNTHEMRIVRQTSLKVNG